MTCALTTLRALVTFCWRQQSLQLNHELRWDHFKLLLRFLNIRRPIVMDWYLTLSYYSYELISDCYSRRKIDVCRTELWPVVICFLPTAGLRLAFIGQGYARAHISRIAAKDRLLAKVYWGLIFAPNCSLTVAWQRLCPLHTWWDPARARPPVEVKDLPINSNDDIYS